MKINANYLNLKDSYLFSTVSRRFREHKAAHPDRKVISLGIGDVTLPLCDVITKAMHEAVDEMGRKDSFRGYAPDQGYPFLQEAVKGYYSKMMGVELAEDEIFISDGAKSEIGNILDLFSQDNIVSIPDPVYPVYVDSNIMDGRKIRYINANESNGFLPLPDPAVRADIIYLCSPNNPTGAVYTREGLQKWVDYANDCGAVILFDAAYESYIKDPALPRSIYELNGAKTCAIEFCSFSKTAGFTGVRCGYTIVPTGLEREGTSINRLWLRRQTTKFNGVPYVVQRAAAATFTDEGLAQIQTMTRYYMENAKIVADAMRSLGIRFTGGENSPYIWLKCPGGMGSWEFFDHLLEGADVVGTPGEGFGKNGEGFFRLTAFGDRDNTIEAAERIKTLLK